MYDFLICFGAGIEQGARLHYALSKFKSKEFNDHDIYSNWQQLKAVLQRADAPDSLKDHIPDLKGILEADLTHHRRRGSLKQVMDFIQHFGLCIQHRASALVLVEDEKAYFAV